MYKNYDNKGAVQNGQDFLGTMYINLVSTAREVDDKEEEEERMEQLHGEREDND